MTDIAGQPIVDTRAWRCAELAECDWTTHLSALEISALHDMADALPADDKGWLEADRRQIMTPAVDKLLETAR